MFSFSGGGNWIATRPREARSWLTDDNATDERAAGQATGEERKGGPRPSLPQSAHPTPRA